MDFEFIRPAVLWLLLPVVALFAVALIKHKKNQQGDLIAPHLAQFVISDNKQTSGQPMWLVALFCLLAVLFSAGPSFEEKQVPVFQSKNARVIVMDMSLSMYSTDIAPNRLVQARFKALDMIDLFKEGDTALVAYAGTAYTISPLTNDATTLENLIPSLSPDIMPDKGSNVLAGLDEAKELLTQAGYLEGDIILITDGIEQNEQSDINQFTAASRYRLNVYGVGTEQGAPIKLPEGGFLKDSYGQIVVPTINTSRLSSIANNSGGKFALYQPSPRDISVFAPSANTETLKDEKQSQALWRIDAGIYGLFILLPLMLWMFRKSALLGAFMVVCFLPQQNAYAVELPSIFKNQDQRALDAYQQGEFEQAATEAQSSQLKGAALYQQGNFDAALNTFSQDKSATGLYNYGNALAKAGKLDEAIETYKQAQALQPDFTQAKENQALVEQLKNQQQQQNQDSQNGEQGENQDQQNEQNQQQQNQQQSQQGEQSQDSQSPQSDQQSEQSDEQDEPQNGDPSTQQSDEQNEPEMQAEPEQSQQSESSDSPQAQNEEQAQPSEQTQPQMSPEQQQAEEAAKQQAMQAQTAELTNEEKEKAQQLNQLLRKVPDDPAILLRNKMQLEAQKRNYQRRPQGVEKSW
ncbi:VWA domain-containing protein [Pseudoalteromonas shioyasakiensis]|uniref:VWA domain-containing protein n=1 Tax=Pseudoalteromonas shioyasakiensis TaxID=1190813 RepID=UPI0021188D50|nr:VWA domain-containing protein [Pseudoalteromonas shioyasakiensis]MCQ8877755.1 VWA domain-containing protein [Pseudoalteromonas shioyasakiensis]